MRKAYKSNVIQLLHKTEVFLRKQRGGKPVYLDAGLEREVDDGEEVQWESVIKLGQVQKN